MPITKLDKRFSSLSFVSSVSDFIQIFEKNRFANFPVFSSVAHFAATWGPLAWVVTSEIYPTSTRAKQMSMSTASNWLLNFAIGYATPYLVDDVPGSAGLQSNVFWIERSCFTALMTTRTSELTSVFFVHSGEDVVSFVSSSPISAFPKPRVSHSNR